jgi:outer membrane beta-barrel protein
MLALAAPALAAENPATDKGGTGTTAPAGGSAVQQQQKPATLEDKIKSVQGRVFMKKGRFELAPMFVLGLNDAFNQEYAPALAFQYHIFEQFAIRANYGYFFTTKTSNQTYLAKENLTVPDNGSLTHLVALNLEWAPIYGKFSLFGKIVHFDLYLTAGFSAADVNYTGWKLAADGTTAVPQDMSGFHFGGNVGIGERFFIMDWLAIRIELTDTIYNMTLHPRNYVVTDSSGVKKIGEFDQIQNHLQFMIGLSFFFPTSVEKEL